ncbi:MAG: hypothetical protein AAFQ68_25380, partial [Bacteroidota bacterium]
LIVKRDGQAAIVDERDSVLVPFGAYDDIITHNGNLLMYRGNRPFSLVPGRENSEIDLFHPVERVIFEGKIQRFTSNPTATHSLEVVIGGESKQIRFINGEYVVGEP